MTDDSRARLSEVAYERASAQLDHQRARLSEIRTNASILLAATALVASFLGEWSLDKGEGAFGALALGAFVLGVLFGIAPVWPVLQTESEHSDALVARISRAAAKLIPGHDVWGRGPSVDEIIDMNDDPPGSALACAATKMSECAEVNSRITDRRSAWVVGCGALLAVQVLCWVANAIAEK
jgi:hypothetical protein